MRNTQYPENWEKIKLGEVMTVIRGASPRPKGDPRYFGGSIPWVKISDITKVPGKYIYETKDHVTEAGAEKSRLLKKGSLILSNSGTVCVPKFLGVDGCIHDGFVSFPDIPEEIYKDFLLEYFNWIRPYVINENRQGITQVNLNTGIVRDFDLPIPPLPEQHRIVAAIENYFSRLDKAVEALERVKANLKRYRASVLKSAVEGRLVPTEAELAKAEGRDYEPASVLLERIIKERRKKWEEAGGRGTYKAPAAPDTDGLPELPEGWCWATVEQLGIIASGQTPKGIADVSQESGEVPWFKVGDMNSEGNELYLRASNNYLSRGNAAKLGLHVHPAGTVVFPKRGGAILTNKKRILSSDGSYDLNTMGIIPIGDIGSYFWHWFAQIDLGSLADGSNVPQINHGDIAYISVPLPPLSEQSRIVSEAERLLSVNDDISQALTTNLQRSTRLRQAILKWAFEGKLADQDPNDEPALELLERIRLEREAMKPVKKAKKQGRKKK